MDLCGWLYLLCQCHQNYFQLFLLTMIDICLLHLCCSVCGCARLCWDRKDRHSHLRSALQWSPALQPTGRSYISARATTIKQSTTRWKPNTIQIMPATIGRYALWISKRHACCWIICENDRTSIRMWTFVQSIDHSANRVTIQSCFCLEFVAIQQITGYSACGLS